MLVTLPLVLLIVVGLVFYEILDGTTDEDTSCWRLLKLAAHKDFHAIFIVLLDDSERSRSWASFIEKNKPWINQVTGNAAYILHNQQVLESREILQFWKEAITESPETRRNWALPAVMVINPASIDEEHQELESIVVPLSDDPEFIRATIEGMANAANRMDSFDAIARDIARRQRAANKLEVIRILGRLMASFSSLQLKK